MSQLFALLALLEHLTLYVAFVVLWPLVATWALLFTLASLLIPALSPTKTQIMTPALYRVLMAPKHAMLDKL